MKCLCCGSKMTLFIKGLFDERYGAPGHFKVYRCRGCGFGRVMPLPKENLLPKLYEKYYPLRFLNSQDVKNSIRTFPKIVDWLFGMNNVAHRYIQKRRDVLDIGSGSGASLIEINNFGSKAYGIDPDSNALRLAKSMKLNFEKGFLVNNPFPGKKFDYITGSQVIEHESDPESFLKIAGKRLKGGGVIILSFPNMNSIYRRIFGRTWINWHIPFHLNFFTKDSIIKLAKEADLKVIRIKTITPNIWSVIQLRRMFEIPEYQKVSRLWSQRRSNLLLKVRQMILFILVTPINRIVDLFGMGDSVLVILEHEKT